MKQKAYHIKWIDSAGNFGWQGVSEKYTPAQCESIGFLVKESKDCITIALNRATDEGNAPYGELMTIPKIAIKRKKQIKFD